MTKYLISFPSSAMVIAEEDFQAIFDDSHAVIREAKATGVYVFGGGINEDVAPVKVSADGAVAEGTYSETRRIEGGYTILALAAGGRGMGREDSGGLPMRSGTSRVHVRPGVLTRFSKGHAPAAGSASDPRVSGKPKYAGQAARTT